MAKLSLKEIEKKYPKSEEAAIKPLSLEIDDKEFIVIVGPSGCGKSTLLRMIAGLEDITSGELLIDGTVVNSIDAMKRDISMVFQDYALYPHMTVYKNIAFPLEMGGLKKKEIKEQVKKVANILQITSLLERLPKELSGGQRQRVALGRAMVRKPKAFLLDEPLSNLDAKLRVEMRKEIVDLHSTLQNTFIYVTHDQVEAMTMGDRVILLNSGRLEQFDQPYRLYKYPASKFIAEFIGTPPMNVFLTILRSENELKYIQLQNKKIFLKENIIKKFISPIENGDVYCGIRPEDFYISEHETEESIPVQLSNMEILGKETNIYFTIDGITKPLIARIETDEMLNIGDTVNINFDASKLYFFDVKTEKALLSYDAVESE